jgi:antitoxin Phd
VESRVSKAKSTAGSDKGSGRWRLTDAKARFSEVVKLARSRPQRVSVAGRDAVVIVSAETFDRAQARRTGANIVSAFAHPIAADLDLIRVPATGKLRDVDL